MNDPIDIWDIATYDTELSGTLNEHSELICNYFIASERHSIEGRDDIVKRFAPVPHAEDFNRLTERFEHLMVKRTIRAWHYTRLTNEEVEAIQRDGIYLSTLDTIQTRLAAQVALGYFSEEVAARLLEDSPFTTQHEIRANMFWMVTPPVSVDDRGVELLLRHWGGESIYFWQNDPDLKKLLEGIGRPRVLEIAVPLAYTTSSYRAGEEVLANFGRSLGCQPETNGFDLYTQQPLGPQHILAIHSEDDTTFPAIARGYPARYVEIDSESE